MPDEVLITQIENVLSEVIRLGGESERSQMVPNLTVQDANPSGLSGFIIVSDDRDGDNIVARKVPDVIYTNGDLVNVIFPKGTEAIAFQQGSGSSSGSIWSIIAGTSTDIYYDKGDVGIGKSVAPDAALEILDTSQAQLRLTHTEDTDFVDFQIDTNADLTITPSGTGQIILQPTTDSTDFLQVLDADGGTPVLNVDSTNERVGIGTAAPATSLDVAGTGVVATFGDGSSTAEIVIDGAAGSVRDVLYRSGGSNRWILQVDNTAEGGSNAGSDFQVQSRTDAGGALDTVLFIKRSTGDIGINTTGPDAKLDILDTGGAQLRLTHTDGSKFVDFTLDTNHDLTVTPSSTGQVIFQPTTDSTDFFQVLDADGGTPTVNVDSINEYVGIKKNNPKADLDVDDTFNIGDELSGSTGVFPFVVNHPTGGALLHRDGTGGAEGFVILENNTSSSGGQIRGIDGGGLRFTNASAAVEWMRINNDGNVGIDASNPAGRLHVDQSSTTAAIPVLYLDQADVSEEFIRFVGTAAAATLTQSIVDEGDVTTATRQGWLKVYVQDDGNQITDQDYFIPIYTLA